MDVSLNSVNSLEKSVRSVRQPSSFSVDSDMIDTSSSGSNESFYSTRRSQSVNHLQVEQQDNQKDRNRRDTVRLSYSKFNETIFQKNKDYVSPNRQENEPDKILSDEEKIFGSGDNKQRLQRKQAHKSRRLSRVIHSSDSNSSNSAMDQLGFKQATNFIQTFNKIRNYQNQQRSLASQIFEDTDSQLRPNTMTVQNQNDFFYTKSKLAPARRLSQYKGKRPQQAQQINSQPTQRTKLNLRKQSSVVIEEVDDDMDETLIPSDEDYSTQLQMLGGKQVLKQKTLTSINLNHTIIASSESSQKQLVSEDELDFGIGRVNIRPVDLDHLNEFSDNEVIQVVHEEAGEDNIQIMSYGMQLMIINDNCGNFMPVLGTSISEMCYNYGLSQGVKKGKTSFSCSVSYFNGLAGSWEPVIEKFTVNLENITQSDGQKNFLVLLNKELNFNLTESLLKTIKDAYDCFVLAKNPNDQTKEIFSNQKNTNDRFNRLKSMIDFEELDSAINESLSKKDSRIGLEQIEVTPYSICNLTEASILVSKVLDPITAKKYNNFLNRKLQKRSTELSRIQEIETENESINSYSSRLSREVQSQAQTFPVLKVHSCETKNYAVNYEAQVQYQVDQFRQTNLGSKQEEIVSISFSHKSKAVIDHVNLNSNKLNKMYRHNYRNPKYKEFILYGISFKNLKRVLTIRTQYLIKNQTLLDYQVKILNVFEKDRANTEEKILKSGCSLPLPESYNQCAIQLRLCLDSEQSWSQDWPVYAIKRIVKANDPGFLHHGDSFTFFRKQSTPFPDTYDLVLMPPLVIQNCLPVDIRIEFVDTNKIFQKLLILKEETRNVFQFDLQQKIELRLKIEGYSSALIQLDTSQVSKEESISRIKIHDKMNRQLILSAKISQKTAGFKILLFVTNCLINNTDQNLLFFYEEPHATHGIQDKDIPKMVSEPIELVQQSQYNRDAESTQQSKKVHMLTQCKQVYAKIEGSKDVSSLISTFAPGTREKFALVRGNKLYEFGYATQIYLANKDEFIYTKVTTISPLFILVNYTSSTILIAQESTKNLPLFIKPNQQVPFNWNDKDMPKRVAVKIIPAQNEDQHSNFDWTHDFSLSEAGSITLSAREIKKEHFINQKQQEETKGFFSNTKAEQTPVLLPVCRTKLRFLKINRQQNLHQMFVTVEEEEEGLSTMKIENRCENYGLVFHQSDNQNLSEVDVCDAQESRSFTWSNPEGKKELRIQIFQQNYQFDQNNDIEMRVQKEASQKLINRKLLAIIDRNPLEYISVTMDELNKPTETIKLVKKINGTLVKMRSIYINVLTNGYTKILRIQDLPPVTRDGLKIDEEIKQNDPSHHMTFELQLSMVNLSLVEIGKEILTLYLEGISARIEKTSRELKLSFWLQNIQIDNQTETFPLYPVIFKPFHFVSNDVQGIPQFFIFNFVMRLDVPNVLYIELLEFLMRGSDVKMEFSHIMQLIEFATRVGKIFDRNLIRQHSIFQQSQQIQYDISDEIDLTDRNTHNKMFKDIPIRSNQHQSIFQNGETDNFLDAQFQKQLKKRQALSKLKNQNIKNSMRLSVKHQRSSVHKNSEKQRQQKANYIAVEDDQLNFQEGASAISRIYIKKYKGTPLDLRVTLIKHLQTQSHGESDQYNLLKQLGELYLTMTTFENAPLKINALEVSNVFGDRREVTDLFKGYYKQQLKRNMFNFLGASNLLGNPIGFLNSVSTGIKDFWYEPTQGMMIGPAETASGLFRGTKSLLSNTMMGSLDSFGKISSSLSSTLLNITGDTAYLQQRNIVMIQRRPNGVLQGLEQGVGSVLNSGWSGLSGLITKPNEGYQREGFTGFLKGAISGTTGFFVKPIAGTMDLISKTSEGIQNSSKSALELASDERIRPPRPFYLKERIIMEYDNSHANLLSIVPQLRYRSSENAQILQQIDCTFFYNAWIIEERQGFLDWSVLFLTHDCLCKIVRFNLQSSLRQAQQDRSIRDRIVEGSLMQIISKNMLIDLKSIEIHEGKVLDIEFRDSREIVTIKDMEMAQAIKMRVEGLYREQIQEQDGNPLNSLLYKQIQNVLPTIQKSAQIDTVKVKPKSTLEKL